MRLRTQLRWFNGCFACVSQVQEVRVVMEAEMRTQLRRQAAAHTDHLRDVIKVQEQELREEAQEVRVLHIKHLGKFNISVWFICPA